MMLGADLLPFLSSLGSTHAGPVFISLLLGHHLRTINGLIILLELIPTLHPEPILLLLLVLDLQALPILIPWLGKNGSAGAGKHDGADQHC
jgi:hypothetical protein